MQRMINSDMMEALESPQPRSISFTQDEVNQFLKKTVKATDTLIPGVGAERTYASPLLPASSAWARNTRCGDYPIVLRGDLFPGGVQGRQIQHADRGWERGPPCGGSPPHGIRKLALQRHMGHPETRARRDGQNVESGCERGRDHPDHQGHWASESALHRSGWPGFALAVTGAKAFDARQRSDSASKQFSIYCEDVRLRHRVVSFVEDVKADVLHVLGETDRWRTPTGDHFSAGMQTPGSA